MQIDVTQLMDNEWSPMIIHIVVVENMGWHLVLPSRLYQNLHLHSKLPYVSWHMLPLPHGLERHSLISVDRNWKIVN